MKRSITLTGFATALVVLLASACSSGYSDSPEEDGLSENDTGIANGADAENVAKGADAENVASNQSALMDIDHDGPGPGSCKADCVDKCEAKGGAFSECSKSCAKACIGAGCNGNNWEACNAGSNSSSNGLCKFMNSVWEKTCKASDPLKAFCLPFGGCSGCRKKMDQNC